MLIFLAGCGHLFQDAVPSAPPRPEEHLRLGERYEAEGKIPLALQEYEFALPEGNRPDVLAHLGNTYQLLGDIPRAESFFLQSLKENLDQPLVLNNLAALYATQRMHPDWAEKFVTRALRLDPERQPYYLQTLSEVYLVQGRYEEALEAVVRAQRTAPADPLLQKSLDFLKARIEALACGPDCSKERGRSDRSEAPRASGAREP